jgi:hypothetical protein
LREGRHRGFPAKTEGRAAFMARLTKIVDKVIVNYPSEMSEAEVLDYLKEELERAKVGKILAELDITLDGNDVELHPHYDSVVRIRRITGYLSTRPRFNDAKREEEFSRVTHLGAPRPMDYSQDVVDQKYKIYLRSMLDTLEEGERMDNVVIAEKLLQDGYDLPKVMSAITRLSPDQHNLNEVLNKIMYQISRNIKIKGRTR